MNTRQLLCSLHRMLLDCNLKYSYNVIPSNKLPAMLKTKNNLALIVNTDPEDQPGSHWVAIHRFNGNLEVFDSYGANLVELGKYFEELSKHNVKENCQTFQSIYSYRCGEFCLFFLFYRTSGVSYEKILQLFKVNKNLNDRMVKQLYESKFMSFVNNECNESVFQVCENRFCNTANKNRF